MTWMWIGREPRFFMQSSCRLPDFPRRFAEEGERRHWKERLEEIAGFLYGFEELKENNVNYPIANALALFLCGKVLEKPEYAKKAGELAALAGERFTENGLLFGEGIPHEQRSRRGCLPVDLGYNMEETLPSLAPLRTAERGQAGGGSCGEWIGRPIWSL